MVRVFLKGGVWKNSEDEILKAAVQKYGKQQWARVASLLNRKTAKQAKARWHEWLDPDIRKTEWSRAEEEKLLHLAKLLPSQWKTIGPLVGRTATQCQEHYEALLDQAAGDNPEEDQGARAASQGLRAGQIDSHPETKPARPDPIDMDEDEMEMLQEARARLANTQGKKAKRKQREKILAQAKRLADLQKRRELKQAGLLSKAAAQKSKTRRNEIDFGVEIPFHKPAPGGFHDTSDEVARAERIREKRRRDVDYQKINENQYRSRDREALQMEKREAARLKILEQSTEKYAKQDKEQEEQTLVRPRGSLTLPAPTVTDAELMQVAKLQQQQRQGEDGLANGSAATQALLGDYSDRPLPTPMRTPTTGSGATQQSLLREASQLRALERTQTPLITPGQTIDDDEEESEQPGSYGQLPTAAGATPQVPDRAGAGRTPGSLAPTHRDQFGLNNRADHHQGDNASVGASTFASSRYSIRELARHERRAAKRARQDLEAALASLPAPQYEYELAAPDDVEMEDGAVETILDEADQADLEAAEREKQRREAEKLYHARNSVIKRSELPRPFLINPSSLPVEEDTAKRLILSEMIQLLQHDAHAFPVPYPEMDNDKKKTKKRKQANEVEHNIPLEVPLDMIPENALENAKNLIDMEQSLIVDEKINFLLTSKKASSSSHAKSMLTNANITASQAGAAEMSYGPGGWTTTQYSLECLRLELETLQEATASLRRKNDKLESKLAVVNGGYAKRAGKAGDDILKLFADTNNAKIEESVYRTLQSHERRGAVLRVEKLKEEISSLKKNEAVWQKEYGELILERRRQMIKAQPPPS
jgi:pre-mRNA-splicing factor CDC5/CEF1